MVRLFRRPPQEAGKCPKTCRYGHFCWDTLMPCAHLVTHTLVRHLPVIEGQCALTSPRTTRRSTFQANEQVQLCLRIQMVTSPAHRKHSSRKSSGTFRAILSVSRVSATSIMTDETGE
ncbi:hypothetical protein IG631_22872 [Alternaria alternata]|nr:hypothetical protein IG631_22872 [Alternaria alternata]